MTDRITPNPEDLKKQYGPIDEICISGCDFHLEQMHAGAFMIVINRGDDELRINLFGPGTGRVHCSVDTSGGFDALMAGER